LFRLKNVIFKALEFVIEKVREDLQSLYQIMGWLIAQKADNRPELFTQEFRSRLHKIFEHTFMQCHKNNPDNDMISVSV
jgi:hypothetical protein